MNNYKITDSQQLIDAIIAAREQLGADKTFILVDEHTKKSCLSILDCTPLEPYCLINIHSGDENKTLHSLTDIWDTLIDEGATRRSLMINIGGGAITDIGGFAAATFKRGMYFINVPTTLLAAVDASTGGKTSINYQGFKNEIGAFAKPQAVLINTDFFSSLDHKNILSGYAEMVKHALISDKSLLDKMLSYDLDTFDLTRLKTLIEQNQNVKSSFVDLDPYDNGSRKALNLGHTIGHAIESYSYREGEPLLHGFAVMWGLVAELYISCKKLNLNKDILIRIHAFAKENYGSYSLSCKAYKEIMRLMSHDKKNNNSSVINFTLLADIGDPRINQNVTQDEIFEALDFLREN